MQNCTTDGKKNPAEVAGSQLSHSSGESLAFRDDPCKWESVHKTLWGISYLPSLIKNHSLVMAAVQVAAKRRYRTHVENFYRIP